MSWKPIDFQGIVTLDSTVVDLLEQYLNEKEERLARTIIDVIPPPTEGLPAPVSPSPLGSRLKLDDAIEYFSKRDYFNNQGHHTAVSLTDLNKSVKAINEALWEYVSTIEGCVTELFQQLELISLEQWHLRLSQVVGALKEILMHKMDDAIWAIKRLETLLWRCRYACEDSHNKNLLWIKFSSLWSSLLDNSIISHLEKNQEFLRAQYQKFTKRHRGYLSLLEQVEKSLEKLNHYRVLSSLDNDLRKQFLDLFQLLKLWELNCTSKALPTREFVIALRNVMSVTKATTTFRDYYQALRKSLFEKSHIFKRHADEILVDSPSRNYMQESLSNCQAEVHTLGLTIGHYREFLLRADPDPYVRTRLGFPDRVVGSEPEQTKPLLNLGYDTESLSELYDQLNQALKKSVRLTTSETSQIEVEIQNNLHEMSQPLSTHRRMRASAETILDKLQQLDELGSFDNHIIDEVGQIFAKLLRVDWKYNVLHGIPLFHQLYTIHQGLIPPIEDRQHANRINKFNRLLQQVQDWVKNQKSQAHFHDIELDINDIKGYLQDFLGYVQRIFNEKDMTKEKAKKLEMEISKQLLEYRYLFGNFFYQLRQNEAEGQLIRKQFLFVDQYFESIEHRLHEFKQINWPEPETAEPQREPEPESESGSEQPPSSED